jgi:26S proteasome non-ATPase regulatory subunit 9
MEEEDRLRKSIATLIAQRQLLEIEAEAITSELNSPGPAGEPPAGLKDSLVDSEGFPRGDIDIYHVRGRRNRLACIQTDYKELMQQIETLLHQLHALARQALPTDFAVTDAQPNGEQPQDSEVSEQSSEQKLDTPQVPETLAAAELAPTREDTADADEPFAVVDNVDSGSPAYDSGLRVGDQILSFGSVNSQNSAGLPDVPPVVRANVGLPIRVVVRRRNEDGPLALSLTPQTWGGRGLLGCHLMPLSTLRTV